MIAIFNHLFPATPFKKKWHFIGTLGTILFSIFTFISFYSRHPERYCSSICLLYVSCFLILRVIRAKKLFSISRPSKDQLERQGYKLFNMDEDKS